jgi:hypothetical protein
MTEIEVATDKTAGCPSTLTTCQGIESPLIRLQVIRNFGREQEPGDAENNTGQVSA